MSGGWQGSNRSEELPADWPARRREVMERDGGRCVMELPSGARCPNAAVDVDHVGSKWDHSLSNLRALCEPHHDKRTAGQGNDARWKRPRLVKKRRGGPAPGDGWA